MAQEYILNTCNGGKAQEFIRLFSLHGISLTIHKQDLEEIDADPFTVVAHKASQLDENILVEDTSLDVEGRTVGIHIKWLLDHLSTCVGLRATWRTLLAYKRNAVIHIFEGVVHGTIVRQRGKGGFGFDPFFLPEGSHKTLAESKPDNVNARARAVEALVKEKPLTTRPCITDWHGPWQQKEKTSNA